MRNPYSFAPQSRSCVLILAALCAVLAAAPGLAATAPQTPAVSAATPAADFLAGLTSAPAAPETPGVHFLSTGCHSSADCPTGQLCCPLGGADPGDGPRTACFNPFRGHCPLFP
jgi:hypothetical protein